MPRTAANTRSAASARSAASTRTPAYGIARELALTNWISNANLKAYYQFNTINLLADTTVNAHTLTAIGVPVQGTPKFGGSVGLGTSQAFSAVDGADFQPSGNFSISVWIKTTQTGTQYIFQSHAQVTNYAGIDFYITSANKIALDSSKNTGTVKGTDWQEGLSTNTVTNGAWHHVVGTYDGVKLHVYIDGAEEGTGTAWTNAAAFQATNYVRVGCSNNTGANATYFKGSLDDVAFFNGTALSLAQVQTLYANELNTQSTILALATAYYRFEDGAQLTDSTANAHTLTAIGTPTSLTTKFGGSIFLGNSSAYSSVDHADFQPTGAFTIGFWLRKSNTGDYGCVFQSASTNTSGYRQGIEITVHNDNKMRFYLGNNSASAGDLLSNGKNVCDNIWHFVVCTWDGSYMRIYVDGVSDVTPLSWASAPVYNATNYPRIGARCLTGSNSIQYAGQLDDVFLLNGTAMTAGDVAQVYSSARNPVV